MNRLLKTAEIQKRFAASAIDATPGAPESLRDLLRADVERWKKVVRDAGIKAE